MEERHEPWITEATRLHLGAARRAPGAIRASRSGDAVLPRWNWPSSPRGSLSSRGSFTSRFTPSSRTRATRSRAKGPLTSRLDRRCLPPRAPFRPRRVRSALARIAGPSAVELAVLAPRFLGVVMLIIQFGLWFDARQIALAAAQVGARVAREDAAPTPWSGDATAAATNYYDELNTHLLGSLTATTVTQTDNGAPVVGVSVSGPARVLGVQLVRQHLDDHRAATAPPSVSTRPPSAVHAAHEAGAPPATGPGSRCTGPLNTSGVRTRGSMSVELAVVIRPRSRCCCSSWRSAGALWSRRARSTARPGTPPAPPRWPGTRARAATLAQQAAAGDLSGCCTGGNLTVAVTNFPALDPPASARQQRHRPGDVRHQHVPVRHVRLRGATSDDGERDRATRPVHVPGDAMPPPGFVPSPPRTARPGQPPSLPAPRRDAAWPRSA